MNKYMFLIFIGLFGGTNSNALNVSQFPAFPATPPAYKNIDALKIGLVEIGNEHCKNLLIAESVLLRIARAEYRLMLKKEINGGKVICQEDTFDGFPQTPADMNLQVLTNIELLKLVTFKLYALYREVPGERAVGLSQTNVQRVQAFEILVSRELIEAYTQVGGIEVYPLDGKIASWVLEVHRIHGSAL